MSAIDLCSLADLDLRFGATNVTRFADDTGEGRTTEAEAIIAEAIGEASDQVYAILRPAFTTDQVVTLAANDRAVRGAACAIAMEWLSSRRAEFLGPEGVAIYGNRANAARTVLRAMKTTELRPVGEDKAGVNPLVKTHTNRPKESLLFQADSINPRGKGSF